MSGESERRDSERRELSILIRGRMHARPIWVDLIDVSETGCKLRGGHGFARKDENVSLVIDGIKAPLGKVVWAESREAGIAFDGQIHPAVLDFLEARDRDRKERQQKH